MSHSILYRSAYIKMSDNTFVPVSETGDNNVYEIGCDRRRARSWSNAWGMFLDKLSYTEEEITAKVQDVIDRYIAEYADKKELFSDHIVTADEVRKNFGYYIGISLYGHSCSGTSSTSFMNFFRKGINNAKTVEEFTELGVPVYVKNDKNSILCRTEEELKRNFNELRGESNTIVTYSYVNESVYKYKICHHVNRARKEKNEGYTVACGTFRTHYINKVTSRSMSFADDIRYAKVYLNRSSADAVVKRIGRCSDTRFSGPYLVPVKKIDNRWVRQS